MPSPKRPQPARQAPPRAAAKRPHAVVYTFPGEFAHNARTRALVERIDKERTRIDKALRLGGYFFFGTGYSAISGDAGAAADIMPRLAGAMRDSATREAFAASAAAARLYFLPSALLDDIFGHRVAYVQIDGRLREERERRRWFSSGGAGTR